MKLSEFDPREMGTPLAVAIEEMNPGYCELKALELIREARICANSLDSVDPETERRNLEWYGERLVRAVSLLVYARALRNGAVQSKEK